MHYSRYAEEYYAKGEAWGEYSKQKKAKVKWESLNIISTPFSVDILVGLEENDKS